MGSEEIDIQVLVKRTLNSFSRNKGQTVSFILKYLVWDIILGIVVAMIAISMFIMGMILGLRSVPGIFGGSVSDGPFGGLFILIIVVLLVFFFVSMLAIILFLLATPIIYGGLVRVGDGFIDGKPVRFIDFWRLGKRNFWSTIGMVFLMGLIASVATRIVSTPIEAVTTIFRPWGDVMITPMNTFISVLTFIVVLTPLIIEHRERKDFARSIGDTFKVFLRSWKILLKLMTLITMIVSPPIMVLQVIGILTISSHYLSIPLNVMLVIGEMIFISIFMNHLIRSFPELSRSDKDTSELAR